MEGGGLSTGVGFEVGAGELFSGALGGEGGEGEGEGEGVSVDESGGVEEGGGGGVQGSAKVRGVGSKHGSKGGAGQSGMALCSQVLLLRRMSSVQGSWSSQSGGGRFVGGPHSPGV